MRRMPMPAQRQSRQLSLFENSSREGRSRGAALTVGDVARMLEQAGVPRIERSIINRCKPNRQGIAKLDAFFDTNERKDFITPQSVTVAIGEERAKQAANGKATGAKPMNDMPQDADNSSRRSFQRKASRRWRNGCAER